MCAVGRVVPPLGRHAHSQPAPLRYDGVDDAAVHDAVQRGVEEELGAACRIAANVLEQAGRIRQHVIRTGGNREKHSEPIVE